MEQESSLDALVRRRIRASRVEQGRSLDALARASGIGASTLSRIETGHRRIAVDQLARIAAALGTGIDQLVEPDDDSEVVIRPAPERTPGMTTWTLSNRGAGRGVSIAKIRLRLTERPGPDSFAVHPGFDWFTVLSGTALLYLGERVIRVPAGSAAEFSTTQPHAIRALGREVELLTFHDAAADRAHREANGG